MRLADRRGLLQGKYLSTVQVASVELAMLQDARDRSRRFGEDFKARLAAANPELLKTLYPDMVKEDGAASTEVQEVAPEDFDPESSVAWSYEQEIDDPAEARELLEQMSTQREWSMTGEDLDATDMTDPWM